MVASSGRRKGAGQQSYADYHNQYCVPGIFYEIHQNFEKALCDQTGTRPEDWIMRTAPGKTGVDATYIGPKATNPGFRYAELKPFSQNGVDEFRASVDAWGLPTGETQLWFYNPWGIIGQSGFPPY